MVHQKRKRPNIRPEYMEAESTVFKRDKRPASGAVEIW